MPREFKVGDRVRKARGGRDGGQGYEMIVSEVASKNLKGEIVLAQKNPTMRGCFEVGMTGGDAAIYYDHVVTSVADLIAEKETLIADITKQLADAKAQLEALTAPKVGDIYHHRDTPNGQAEVIAVDRGSVFYWASKFTHVPDGHLNCTLEAFRRKYKVK